MRNAELLPGSPVSKRARADAAEELEHWLREQRKDRMNYISQHLPRAMEVLNLHQCDALYLNISFIFSIIWGAFISSTLNCFNPVVIMYLLPNSSSAAYC